MPLSPLTRTSLGLGGIVLGVGAVAALTHDDWPAGLFLAGLGIVCLLASLRRIDAPESTSAVEQGLPEAPSHQGAHTPPTVPWSDHDRMA